MIALFGLVLHRQASLAMKWPVVTGTIKLSDIEQYRAARQDGGSGTRTMYQRKVSYTYQYNNLTYTSTHATSGEQRRLHLKLAGAQIHHRLQGRRQRARSGSIRTIRRRPRWSRARVLCGCYGCQPRRSGAWRITRRCMAELRRVGKGALATCPPSIDRSRLEWWARFALPTLRCAPHKLKHSR